VGVSVKEGETIKWNKDAFSKTEAGVLDKGITLNYWYNKDKIESFSINSRNPQAESFFASIILGAIVTFIFISNPFLGACAAAILAIILYYLEKSDLAITVSVVYKNGNAVSSTAFYNNSILFNVITIWGYGYGAWRDINIDYWRYHP